MTNSSPARARRGLWIVRLLFLAGIVGVIIALAAWSGWLALLLPAVVIAYALIAVTAAARQGAAAASAFRAAHPEKDLLIVHSSDAHSKEYIATEVLPRWGSRAVVLDLSERDAADAKSPARQLFQAVTGKQPHAPMAIVIPRAGPIKVIRLWRAFHESGPRRADALRAAELQLDALLGGEERSGSRRD